MNDTLTESAIPKVILQRHHRGHTAGTGVVTPLVAIEEESLVLNDGPADCAPKSVPDQVCPGDAVVIVDPIVGREAFGTVVVKTRAVPGIRAALGNQVHLGAGRAALVGVSIGRGNPELLDRLGVETQHRTLN